MKGLVSRAELDRIHGTLTLVRPTVLIISEDEAEICCSTKKFARMHYDITIARTWMELLHVAPQGFDLVMLSTTIKSYGINAVLLLFKHAKEINVIPPLLFLVNSVDAMLSDASMLHTLLNQPAVDGMVTLKH